MTSSAQPSSPENSTPDENRSLQLEKLRAEIWKLATTAQDETTLVQTLLNKAGPVMGCENIAFMPYDEKMKEIKTQLQWRADSKNIGLDETVPSWIFKPYLGRPYVQFSFDDLPLLLKPILKPIQQKYGTRSVMIIPYGNPHQPDGYISVNNYHQAKAYSPAEIDLFIELSKIIHLRSQQLRSQAALQASEKRYRQIFETNQAIKLIINPADGCIVEANQAAADFYGYDINTLNQMRIMDLNILPEADIRERMARAMNRQQFSFNFEHRLASGEIRQVEAFPAPIDIAGQTFIYAIIHDVTQRYRAQEALERTTAMLNESQRIAKIGSYETNLQTGAWVASDSFIEIFGLPRKEQYTIEEFTAIVHPDDVDEVMAYFNHCLATQQNFNYEYRCLRTDGKVIYVNNHSKVVYSPEGKPLKLVGIKQDITEHKQIEQQLVQQERLAAVGQLAAGIAHDFNNILAVMLGFAEILHTSPELPPAAHQKLEQIITAGQRAAHLVRQILDFSQKTIRHPQEIDLGAFLQESILFLEHTLPENIRLNLQIEPGKYWVEADPTQLQQVLTNLAINARDAMQTTGGALHLALTRQVEAGEHTCTLCQQPIDGEWVQITVSDTGQGIAPHVLPRVFEPFFTTKEVGQGVGLGLAQVAGVVGQHRGHIRIESRPGHGTSIFVFLPPLAVPAAATLQAKSLAASAGQGETILLVEDEPDVQAAIAAMLEYFGYHVIIAANGEEALAMFEQHQPRIDLVLSDMVMPDMNGEALFHHLKARDPHLKMVIMSGYPLTDIDPALLAQGVTWFQKPASFSQLSRVINQALSNPGGRWD